MLIFAIRLDFIALDPYRGFVRDDYTALLLPVYAHLDSLYPKLQPLLPARALVFCGGMDAANRAELAVLRTCSGCQNACLDFMSILI